MRRSWKRGILGGTAVLLLAVGFATYKMAWGKPFGGITVLVDRQAFVSVLDDPELLTSLGFIDGGALDFHSGRLTEISEEKKKRERAAMEQSRSELDWYAGDDLQGQERLTYEIMRWFYDVRLETVQKFPWLPDRGNIYVIDQMNGVHVGLPRFMEAQHVVKNALMARNFVRRLEGTRAKFRQAIEAAERQAGGGVIPPRIVIEKILADVDRFLSIDPSSHPLLLGYRERLAKLEDLGEEEKSALGGAAASALHESVYPAYRDLKSAYEGLLQRTTEDAGIWRLPDGDALYARQLRFHTTLDMPAEEIHSIGLSEVSRIAAEMDTILNGLGMSEGPVGERMRRLGDDPQHLLPETDKGREQAIARYRGLIEGVYARVPGFFETVPPQPVEVVRIPAYTESTAPGAYYQAPALDGSRPGRFFINMRTLKENPLWGMPTLTYHEAVPGHHFQLALAQRIDGIPMFRRAFSFSVFSEGWALYAEKLAKEMGLYDGDPLGDLGRLQAELFRSVRLVVDTGIHHKRWTRAQAIAYMLETTGMDEGDVVSEIDRYIVNPGQACAYKIGMLRIEALRRKAEEELGSHFDLKRFHTAVIGSGSVPLPILDRIIADWIAAEKATS